MNRLIFLILLITTALVAAPSTWKEDQIIPTMQELLFHHIEYKKMHPDLVARSSKIFFQALDVQKVYLLQEEFDKYCNMSKEQWAKVAASFDKRDISFYQELNATLQRVITRARDIRKEIEKELIFQTNLEDTFHETYVGYAKNPAQLKLRMRKQALDFLRQQKSIHADRPWNIETRKKVFALLEKKVRRMEDRYLEGARCEHYFTLHLLKALARSLDAHTAVFSEEEALQMRMSLEKEFFGYGLICQESLDGVRVLNIIKNSPADLSGKIKEGDLLVGIDGKSMDSLAYDEFMRILQQRNSIQLRCKRLYDGEPIYFDLELQAGKIILDDERLRAETEPVAGGVILKLNLTSFYESDKDKGCEADIRRVIRETKKDKDVLGIILDLRENSGGFLQQAVKVAGLFISNGVVVISKYSGGEMRYLRQIDGRVYHKGPLIILTSKASASAAEIVAQALQDYGSALVVGDERTYGKGTIQYQTVTDQNARTFYKVTIGKYYTVSGRSTQIEGVHADIVVPTQYAGYRIGERFLDYPLPSDFVASAYVDPLTDIEDKSKTWFQKNYTPYVQKKEARWKKMVPTLQNNSTRRIQSDQDFQVFLQKHVKAAEAPNKESNWGKEDLPMQEAVNIIKDMIFLQS